MLLIHKRFGGKVATDPALGNVQIFLEQLLADVVAGNYRHFVHEQVLRARSLNITGLHDLARHCTPPLLASEREFSGLVSSALSAYTPVFWPEQRVARPPAGAKDAHLRDGYDDEAPSPAARRGAADFVAAFGGRLIGLECKRATMTLSGSDAHKVVLRKWVNVCKQGDSVIDDLAAKLGTGGGHLNLGPLAPIALSLLVLRVHRPWGVRDDSEGRDVDDELEDQISSFEKLAINAKNIGLGFLQGLDATTGTNGKAPQFVASYTLPKEMQHLDGFKNGISRLYPGVLFLARVRVRAGS